MSARQSARTEQFGSTRWSFMKFDFLVFLEDLLGKFSARLINLTRIAVLHTKTCVHLCAFMKYLAEFLA
jgi:hypothetical protein